jgi:hypothetical protein
MREYLKYYLVILLLMLLSACSKKEVPGMPQEGARAAFQETISITQNGVSVDLVIDKPEGRNLNALLVFHGTVNYDSLILQAAENSLRAFKNLLDDTSLLIISVAYPEENLLFGDNIYHCEAALLWLRTAAEKQLDFRLGKVFLAGHSQGGYLVTRLNAMHPTDGAVANGPGPLNLFFRCQLEENGQVQRSPQCNLLRQQYGPTSNNPGAYFNRSLQNYTSGMLGDLLVVQGMQDGPIQMHLWPAFKQALQDCSDCQNIDFLELPGYGHAALFQSVGARQAFNAFLNR